jgi:hypothetical protein
VVRVPAARARSYGVYSYKSPVTLSSPPFFHSSRTLLSLDRGWLFYCLRDPKFPSRRINPLDGKIEARRSKHNKGDVIPVVTNRILPLVAFQASSTTLIRSMASTLLIHTTMPEIEQSWEGRKPTYTSRDSSRGLPLSEQPPAPLVKESMEAPTTFSDSGLMRLITNNAQRLHTDVKGLWNSAPRSAHPAGMYERGVDYPRLFQLDSSYNLNVKEVAARQGLRPASDFRLATVVTSKVPAKAFSDRQCNTCISNPIETARQVGSHAIPLSNRLWSRAHMTPRG